LTCRYFSRNDNVRPVEHLHEVASGDEQGDVAVPGGDHLTANNAWPPVISRFDGVSFIRNGFGFCLVG
jgi:hypothetical protein